MRFRHLVVLLSFSACAVTGTALAALAAKPKTTAKPASAKAAPARPMDTTPFWASRPTPLEFAKTQDERLARAKAGVDKLTAVKGTRTIENTLRVYDDIQRELDLVGSQSSLLSEVHPDSAMRDAGEKAIQRVASFGTDLSLNRAVYDALVAIDASKADPETRYYLEKTLREFRLSGVDKDQATRDTVKALNEELVLISQEFSRNIREGVRTITVKDASELAGLPDDYIARHKPAADSTITLTTDYPDALPLFSYAKSEDVRKRMFMEFNNRAFPKNVDVLNRMIAKRNELATRLGFPNWADYITSNKMVGSGKNAASFIDKVVEASAARATADYQVLLARKQKDVPGAPAVNAWEGGYYAEAVRRSDYDFDNQKMRPYLPYDEVKRGVLDVTSQLFGVTYRPVKDVPVWDPSVDCYEMLEDGVLVGRFYLDMHPRENKFKHAAQFDVRTGIGGRQIPEAALICNFPGGIAGDPGLMEFSDVKTFFHEFGHLVHTLFAGRHQWIGVGGTRTEQDFVEAPSQMLEEWVMDHSVLATFAKHYETGEVIPATLVAQMRRASDFGKGLNVRRQMILAKTSLSCYDRAPAEVDVDVIIKDLNQKYSPIPYVNGTHMQCAFGHLDGYSAVYYTYMWSLVIAKDMFSQFDRSHLLDPKVSMRYRNTVLTPGGSAPAADLVAKFLGRPFSFEAYRQWLNEAN